MNLRMHWLLLALAACCLSGGADPLRERLDMLPAAVGEQREVQQRAGENWVQLGIREHVGYEHLKRANPAGFGPGRQVFIPGLHPVEALVRDGLVLNLPALMLYRWQDGTVAAWYPISIGRASPLRPTPTGAFTVINRTTYPTWRRPSSIGGGSVPPGPRNPLGDRWMGLSRRGYGIHGTNDPSSIGRTVSMGCVRMFPPHVRELYEAVPVGIPVIITYETVAVGQRDGIVYLALYPDVYRRHGDHLAHAKQRLAGYDVAGVLSDEELRRRLRGADGVARPLLGSDIAVTVNGAPFAALPINPTMREGALYLPARTLAEAMGARLREDGATRAVTLSRGFTSVTFAPREGEGFSALGDTFIPVRAAVEGLGGRVNYTARTLAIRR